MCNKKREAAIRTKSDAAFKGKRRITTKTICSSKSLIRRHGRLCRQHFRKSCKSRCAWKSSRLYQHYVFQSLINSLNETKSSSTAVAYALSKSNQLQIELDNEYSVYKKVANLGSSLYFAANEFRKLNVLYMLSISSFTKLFLNILLMLEVSLK